MGQEFIIKSKTLEDKINQLLPSQGGFQAGVDLSASTTIIPIVNLTESAEGSNLREDLQTAFSHTSITAFSISNATTTIVNTTGYYRVFGAFCTPTKSVLVQGGFKLNDGASDKIIYQYNQVAASAGVHSDMIMYDFIVFLGAGDSLIAFTNTADAKMDGSTRQIADVSGNLINPL